MLLDARLWVRLMHARVRLLHARVRLLWLRLHHNWVHPHDVLLVGFVGRDGRLLLAPHAQATDSSEHSDSHRNADINSDARVDATRVRLAAGARVSCARRALGWAAAACQPAPAGAAPAVAPIHGRGALPARAAVARARSRRHARRQQRGGALCRAQQQGEGAHFRIRCALAARGARLRRGEAPGEQGELGYAESFPEERVQRVAGDLTRSARAGLGGSDAQSDSRHTLLRQKSPTPQSISAQK